MNALTYLVCALTTFSLTWLVTRDSITTGLRQRLEATADTGVYNTTHGTPATRWQRWAAWLAELVGCPFCASAWLGLAVALAWLWLAAPDLGWQESLWAVGTSTFVSRILTGIWTWLALLADPDR